jgi:hypothetical protein
VTWLVPLLCPGVLVVGWLWLALCVCCGLAEPRWRFLRPWLPVGRWRPWFAARWRYSTTVGFAIVMHPEHGARVLQHELVHVRQFRDAGLLALCLAGAAWLADSPVLALLLWLSGPLYLVPHYAGAILAGGHAYLDAEHERSAYAQTALVDGRTWLERRESERAGTDRN